MRRAVLHIGTEKTGSTSIQRCLAARRGTLPGVRYALSPGIENHTGLAAYAQDDAVHDDLRQALGVASEDVAAYRRRLERDLAAEVDAHGASVFLFSNEHCQSRLCRSGEVGRLACLLHRFFDEVRVVVYLRRQDRLAVSRHATTIRYGATDRDVFAQSDVPPDYWDYEALLDRWAGAFGEASLVVRLYERASLASGSVVADFARIAGFSAPEGEDLRENRSLAPAALELLRLMNPHLPVLEPDGRPGEARGPLVDWLEAMFPGTGPRPARAEARAFLDRFAASNERVRRAWFSGRATLFDEDFDDYPETAEALPAPAALAEVAAALWARAERERVGRRDKLPTEAMSRHAAPAPVGGRRDRP